MRIPDHLTCLLRNLYAGQEATFRTGHGTADWFQIGKGVGQGCIFSPCLFNLYAEYIMRNGGLEAQAGIKTTRRNINNLRYADDTTLMAESKEIKSLAGGQREELCPWQRSWGRRLGMIKPQETPCSRASNPKTRVCFMLSPTPLTLQGTLPHNRFSRRRSKRAAPRQ